MEKLVTAEEAGDDTLKKRASLVQKNIAQYYLDTRLQETQVRMHNIISVLSCAARMRKSA